MMKIVRGPRDHKDVGAMRISALQEANGGKRRVTIDNWTKVQDPHKIVGASTGYTIFIDDVVWPRDGRGAEY